MIWGHQIGTGWKKTEQFKRVNYRDVYVPHYRQVIMPEHWPEDLRPVLETFLSAPDKWVNTTNNPFVVYASPRFYLVKDGKLIITGAGLSGWQYRIAPTLAQLVGGGDEPKKLEEETQVATAAPAPVGDPSAFDGTWAVTHTCLSVGTVPGYVMRYDIEVKNGSIAGRKPPGPGQADSLSFTGEIRPDGTALIHVSGVAGAVARGKSLATPGALLNYDLTARFVDSRGTGTRVNVRPCDLVFIKR